MKRYRLISYFLISFFFVPLVGHVTKKKSEKIKEFEIVIPSFNNIPWVEKNLRSVCFQNYPCDKYHITYINDASTDGTGEFVADFINKNHLEKRVTLINNTVRKGALENRYRAFHNLPGERIIVECDGDDFFENENVLNELNKIYHDPEVWMLYTTTYRTFPVDKINKIKYFTAEEIAKNSFRDFKDKPTCQLRSYYVWLFGQIKLKDLLYNGHFYPILTDPAYMIPMLEMAGPHNRYVNKVLYLRNTTNPLSVKKTWSMKFRKKVYAYMSAQKPYARIKNHEKLVSRKTNQMIEAIICCSSLSAGEKVLVDIQKKISGINGCSIFLETSYHFECAYQSEETLPFKIKCLSYNADKISLQKMLAAHLRQTQSDYIVLLSDENICIDEHINVQDCVNALQDCCAEVFYFRHELPVLLDAMPCVQIKDHIWASQCKYRKILWGVDCTFNTVLCSKKYLLNLLSKVHSNDIQSLNRELTSISLPPREIGLFFDKKHIA